MKHRPLASARPLVFAAVLLASFEAGRARADYVKFESNVWPVFGTMVLDLPGVPADADFESFDPAAVAAFTVWEGSSGDYRMEMSAPLSAWLDSDPSGASIDNALVFLQATDSSFFGPSQALVSLTADASGSQIYTAAGAAPAAWFRSARPRLPSTVGAHFLHVADNLNITGSTTLLRHPQIDGDRDAILIVTPHFAPANTVGTVVDYPIAVQYDAGTGFWSIVDQTGATIPDGSAFNVLVPPRSLDPVGVRSGRAFIHERTNTVTLPSTQMLHPATTGNPGAVVAVTQNLTPRGASAPANPHPLGVYFDGGWWRIANSDNASMPTGSAYNVYVGEGQSHEVTLSSASLVASDIAEPAIDGDPRALVHVQRVHDPAAGGTIAPVAAGYNTFTDRHAVVYMAGPAVIGDRFHVLVLPQHDLALRESSFSSSSVSVNHVLTNERTGITPQVAQLHTGLGTPTPAEFALDFVGSTTWSVARLDGGSLAGQTEVALRVPREDMASFAFTTTAASVGSNSTWLRHPLSDDDPDARIFVTQSRDGVAVGTSNLGVWYTAGSWLIFNQDLSSMASDLLFHVYIAGPDDIVFAHAAAAATLDGEFSWIDHPELNDHPHVVPLVTQNWALSGVYNDHPVGLRYDDASGRWAVWNSDGAAIPAGATFNILANPATCGDLDRDGVRSSRDVRDLRNLLAARSGSPSLDHCSVSGGPDDCDALDFVLMQREQLRVATSVAPAPLCRAVVGG